MGGKSYWELVEEVGKGLCPTFHEDGSWGAAPQQSGCTLKSSQGPFFSGGNWEWDLGCAFVKSIPAGITDPPSKFG